MSETRTRFIQSLRLLSPKDAGLRLGVSAARVVQLADAGRLRAVKDSSGRRSFLEEDVEQCARERRAG